MSYQQAPQRTCSIAHISVEAVFAPMATSKSPPVAPQNSSRQDDIWVKKSETDRSITEYLADHVRFLGADE